MDDLKREGKFLTRRLIDPLLRSTTRYFPTPMKSDRDIDKTYPIDDFIAKLRRLADCLESGEQFEIQIAGERIYVPVRATYSIEHEREDGSQEIEFQIKWDA